jgi:hypothetical protein
MSIVWGSSLCIALKRKRESAVGVTGSSRILVGCLGIFRVSPPEEVK